MHLALAEEDRWAESNKFWGAFGKGDFQGVNARGEERLSILGTGSRMMEHSPGELIL